MTVILAVDCRTIPDREPDRLRCLHCGQVWLRTDAGITDLEAHLQLVESAT